MKFKGVVYDDITKEPLEACVVYLNGSTKGTITNAKGEFYLEVNAIINESLIISHLGYQNETLRQDQIKDNNNIIIYLKKQLEVLDPVFVENDDWSREKKMHYFKMYFIGSESIQNNCIIENENDIDLFYNASNNTLVASSYVPLKIRNDLLGYSITYELATFELEFKHKGKGKPVMKSVFFMGTSFFEEIEDTLNNEDTKANYVSTRKSAYQGSVLHFMRSLADNTLMENGFELFSGTKKVKPRACFKVDTQNGTTKVLADVKKITVVYDKSLISGIKFKSETTSFNIDGFGNYRPVRLFQFSGYMGSLKVGKLIPLDYGLEN